ncbi:hypothetical protein [Peribacillus sp. SCS-155]|uniref:hypothetical protein n=1 Tax=Peribacillus sedimenti TaxID=3115297 RepID=UPI0039062CC0
MVHRGRWSQTNGWALWHHSSSTFLIQPKNSIDGLEPFSFSVVNRRFCDSWRANGGVDPRRFTAFFIEFLLLNKRGRLVEEELL